MVKSIDYDKRLHKTYQRGRRLSDATLELWMETIAKYLPSQSRLTILDVGSGTGRFAPRLAERFAARVTGIEPSEKMRAIAEAENAHEAVEYVDGCAERLPAGNDTFDVAFLSMVIHHVNDIPAVAIELRRVLKPGGVLFIRNSFRNRLDSVRYYDYFPRGKELDSDALPSVESVERAFSANGFEELAFETVLQTTDESFRDYYERIKLRALSTFERITEEEFQEGVARMQEDVVQKQEPSPVKEEIDLLVLKRSVRQ